AQASFPENLDTPAISLAMAGAPVGREDLLLALARSVENFSRQDAKTILREFAAASSYATAKRVRVEQNGRRIGGVTAGLGPWGFLRVREDSGLETIILAGGVRACC